MSLQRARVLMSAVLCAGVLGAVSLTNFVAAQGGQRQTATEQQLDAFQAASERIRSVPDKVPPFAPTQPWWGQFLPDGQPDLPRGIWRIYGPGVRYIDVPSPGRFMASRVVDPPDGKVPYQPWALEVKRTMPHDVLNPTQPWHVDSTARCLNTVPRLMYYVTEYEILQSPGYIVFHFQLEHIARVIPLDGSPHIGSDIKLWMGDARGRWQGNTLLVDTTNLNAKTRLSSSGGDFHSPNARIKERMTFINATTMIYEATIDDPTVFTRPWTIRVEHRMEPKVLKPGREPEGEIVEYMCHEGSQDRPSEVPATLP